MQVKVNMEKNILYMKLTGKVSLDVLREAYTNVRFAVADMKPGFGAITDLRECDLCYLDGVTTYKRIMKHVVGNGVGEVVRIIDENGLLFKQLQGLSQRITAYLPVYVKSQEEAEHKIDSNRRSGLRFHYMKMQPVRFASDETMKNGHVRDISTSGCLIGFPNLPPALDEEIEVLLSFFAGSDEQQEFPLNAKVVRHALDSFAVSYTAQENARREQLQRCLYRQFENEL